MLIRCLPKYTSTAELFRDFSIHCGFTKIKYSIAGNIKRSMLLKESEKFVNDFLFLNKFMVVS